MSATVEVEIGPRTHDISTLREWRERFYDIIDTLPSRPHVPAIVDLASLNHAKKVLSTRPALPKGYAEFEAWSGPILQLYAFPNFTSNLSWDQRFNQRKLTAYCHTLSFVGYNKLGESCPFWCVRRALYSPRFALHQMLGAVSILRSKKLQNPFNLLLRS